MKALLIACLSLLLSNLSFASPYNDSLTNELNRSIKDAHIYDNIKLTKITRLKNLLQDQSNSTTDKRYNIINQLYDEYKYYNYDAALVYAKELERLANNKNFPSLIIDAKLKVAFVMLSSGMFKETFDLLNPVSAAGYPDSVKAEYYSLMGRAYYNLADFNDDAVTTPFYNHKANLYLDSAIGLYPSNSFDNIYYSAIRFLKKNNTDSALYNLNELIDRKDLSWHEIALATSTKGGIFLGQGREDEAKPYLIRASVADIKSSTKETLALLRLAGIIYKEGKIEEAVLYIEKANADATFYNTRLRKVQIGAILPLIEGEMINTITNQKEKLRDLLIVLSVLVLLLAAFAVIIRNQVKKLKIVRKSLFEANIKQQQINQQLLAVNELKEKYNTGLTEINSQLVEANQIKENYNVQLQDINHQLLEANKIKEEYIGNYFNWETEFLGRIEKIITSIDKKLGER